MVKKATKSNIGYLVNRPPKLSSRQRREQAVWCAVGEERSSHFLDRVVTNDSRVAKVLIPQALDTMHFESAKRRVAVDRKIDKDMPVDLQSSGTSPYEIGLRASMAVCPACWAPLEHDDFACVDCALPLDSVALDIIQQLSFEAAYFGWIYRTRYERDSKARPAEHELGKHYLLPLPTEELSWAASVVVAALIGGATVEGAKAILKRAWKRFRPVLERKKRRRTGAAPRTSGTLDLANDDSIKEVTRYLADYLDAVMGKAVLGNSELFQHALGKALVVHKALTGEEIPFPASPEEAFETLRSLQPTARHLAVSVGDLQAKIQLLELWIVRHGVGKRPQKSKKKND